MPGCDGPDPLLAALDELAALGTADDRVALDALRGRLQQARLRVLVAGEAKRGKSTLVNALLGRAVLPSGVTPLTALATTVRYGRRDQVSVVFADGHTERFPLDALEDLVTERRNPGNRRNLSSVSVRLDVPVLARGVELVDTPGTGSVYAHNTTAAEAALETMDAAVFVLTADPPVSASEQELMARVVARSVRMFVVLNKADYLTPAELAEAVEFTGRVAGDAAGQSVQVYPVSARAALSTGTDPGFAAFQADFTAYLDQGRVPDLRRSAAGQAGRLAAALRDEAALARRAAELRSGDAASRVEAFAARLAAVAERRRDAADLVRAESARMLAQLNEAAQRAARDRTGQVAAELTALLDGAGQPASAAGIERSGRARLAELAVAAAESWRQQQAAQLEDGLARLDQRMTDDLRSELAAVRAAAADLLGLALTMPGGAERLAPDLRFFYVVSQEAGQTELLAGAVRRHLPGQAGRRRARAYLRREATELVPRQIGRARADLQYRLADATRQLVRVVQARYTEGTGRLERALQTATARWEATAGAAAQQDRELAAREQALGRIGVLLGEAAAGAVPERTGRP
ncbi:MAG TPA: dynamin family protein [Streptosporangiaceae bacterium]|nr:dynamin family protein [Streptosporangiaceae bacterium]